MAEREPLPPKIDGPDTPDWTICGTRVQPRDGTPGFPREDAGAGGS
jgi:hypothetical protein